MKKKSAGSVAIMLLVMIYLLIPLVISIIYSVFHKWTGVVPEGFTLHNYVDLFQTVISLHLSEDPSACVSSLLS